MRNVSICSDDENNDDRLVIDTESRQVALPAKRAKVIVSDDDDSDADSSPHAEVGGELRGHSEAGGREQTSIYLRIQSAQFSFVAYGLHLENNNCKI